MEMNKLIKFGLAFCLPLALLSCEKDTEGVSFETHYPTFEMAGTNPYNLAIGTSYVEPGIKAYAGTEELTVESSNNIDEDVLGIYVVDYSATNSDGFSASTTRTVAVYDPSAPTTDFSGTYVSSIVRTEADGSVPRPRGDYSVEITKVGPGIFYVSDLLGGFYAVGSGYGSAYAMHGYIALNADNTLTLLSSHVDAWGDSLADFYDGVYDPDSGGFTWKSVYAGGDIFTVTLK